MLAGKLQSNHICIIAKIVKSMESILQRSLQNNTVFSLQKQGPNNEEHGITEIFDDDDNIDIDAIEEPVNSSKGIK